MSYLERLIERATDTTLNSENNQIGNYLITPEHGNNLIIYHIFKNNCKEIGSTGNRCQMGVHVISIKIYDNKVDVKVNNNYLTHNDISNVHYCIHNLYYNKDITFTNF